VAVTDLNVIEKGDQLLVTFHTPARTTDNLGIKQFSEVDLRMGPSPTPFDFDKWEISAKHYALPLPPPNDPDDPRPQAVSTSVPTSVWEGQHIAVIVRTAIKKKTHYSAWSNRATLDVVPPLQPPVVKAEATKAGWMLTWTAGPPGVQYQIFRQGPAPGAPTQIGSTQAAPYVDTTSQWDARYTYTVVAQRDSAQSLPSEPLSVIHANTFPPAPPASITALSGPESIEVSWSRSAEPDLKGYYVYRSTNGGPYTRQGELLVVPTFSDHAVEHGKSYRYSVTIVSQKDLESDKSAPTEALVF